LAWRVLDKLRAALRGLKPGRPYHAQWFVTNRCNYRCRGCDVWLRQASRPRELDADEIKEGLKELEKLGVVELVITGGNPLLREDIGEIVREASRRFITTVYDNGSLAADKVDELKHADFVTISLDSLRPEVNDYVKGVKGAWRKAVNSIITLKEEGLTPVVSAMISQLNLNEVVAFSRFWASRGVPVIYCLYYYDPPAERLFSIGREVDELVIRDGKSAAKVFAEIEALRSKECPLIWVPNRTLRAIKLLFERGERTWTCAALSGFIMVDQEGRVSGCHRKPPIGSVFEINELWESEELQALRAQNRACRECIYLCYIFYSQYSTPASMIALSAEMARSYLALRASRWRRERTFPRRPEVLYG